jgi:hypothetical protein
VNSPAEPTDEHRRATLIRWQHRSGDQAEALARLITLPEAPVIVLSELASNPDATGLVSDFAGAASAALDILGAGLTPASIRWLAHHGDFSSHDAQGAPETFTEVEVRFDGGQLHSDLTDQRLLQPAEAHALTRDLDLEPVPDALRRRQAD